MILAPLLKINSRGFQGMPGYEDVLLLTVEAFLNEKFSRLSVLASFTAFSFFDGWVGP